MTRVKGLAVMLIIGLLFAVACYFTTTGSGVYDYEFSTEKKDDAHEPDTTGKTGGVLTAVEDPDSVDSEHNALSQKGRLLSNHGTSKTIGSFQQYRR